MSYADYLSSLPGHTAHLRLQYRLQDTGNDQSAIGHGHLDSAEILAEKLPREQLRLSQVWIVLQDELMVGWEINIHGGEKPPTRRSWNLKMGSPFTTRQIAGRLHVGSKCTGKSHVNYIDDAEQENGKKRIQFNRSQLAEGNDSSGVANKKWSSPWV